MSIGHRIDILIINIEDIGEEKPILDLIDGFAKHVNVKSRNFSPNGIDMIAEIRTKQEADLMKELVTHQAIKAASLVAHDGEKEF